MAETNLVAAAAILFTSATYSHITHWAELCNLQFLSKTTHYDVQSSYPFLVIEETYQGQQRIVFARLIGQSLDGEGVEVCGDARSDSPGHSAKYSTYSFMDDSTKQIVLLDLVQVTQAKSSVAMEPLGFKNGLRILLDEGLDIKVITTDRHPSIRKIMRESYPEIKHEFDPWHTAKGIKKKLLAASVRKDCKDLAPWMKSVANHIWWCCSSSKGDKKVHAQQHPIADRPVQLICL
ncbi:hypothetical protein ABVT39_012062 [Epinephelus coioides]